ncbi:MAG: hypothetical protein Q6J18_04170 [Gloeomargarita sp. DG02_3_bins_56]
MHHLETWLNAQDYAGLITQVEQVLATDPQAITAWGYGGLAYLLQEDAESAQAWWLQALTELDENRIQALGDWLWQQGESYRESHPTVSLELYRAAQELAPSHERRLQLTEWAAIQAALLPEELAAATEMLSRSDQLPEKAVYKTLLAVVGELKFNSQIEQFIRSCQRHLSPPVYARALSVSAGKIQWKYQNPATSEYLLKMALEYDPNNTEVLGRLANLYEEMNDLEQALGMARYYVQIAASKGLGEQARAWAILMRVLMTMGGQGWAEAVEKAPIYHQVLSDLAQASEAELSQSKNRGDPPFTVGFFLPYLRDDPARDRPVLNRIVSQAARQIRNHTDAYYTERAGEPSSRLRVGFVSRSLTRHSVGWLARWFFESYDRSQLELFLYYITSPPDALGESWFVRRCEHYFYGDYANEVARKIADDGIQILIDVDSLTLNTTCAVLAFKPAPIQVTWLGWDASGMDTVDYFIADPLVLPANAQDYYHEKIWRLPETYIAVNGFEIGVPDVRREDLGIAPDAVIFFSAQSGYKRHPDNVRWQIEILQRTPNSYLCIKSLRMNAGLQEQFRSQAAALGVDPQRLRFLPPVNSEYVHRANLQCLADVILDTYPYNGATTTLEALWLGIPLVTRVGQQFAARNSYAFLTQCGISEGIAHSAEEYIAWGVRLGTDAELRREIRQRLLASRRSSPLWDGRRFARQFGNALQEMWQVYQSR